MRLLRSAKWLLILLLLSAFRVFWPMTLLTPL
jgi:hypothetical protein